MKRWSLFLVSVVLAAGAVLAACSQAPAPAPPPAAPTKAPEPAKATAAPAAAPTKAPEPTKPAAQPTAAPTKPAAQPTAAPATKSSFPEKGRAVTLIVAFAAGGPADGAARLLALQLEKDMGVPVQVINKPGAGMQVGLTDMVTAKPDGYTFGSVSLPTAIGVYLDADRKANFNAKSFEYLGSHGYFPVSLAVPKESPFKSPKDVIDAAKASPEKVKLGTIGILSTNHLATLKLEKMTGARFGTVFFDSTAPLNTALIGGHIDAAVQLISGYGGQTQNVKVLAVWDKQEHPFYPGIPTMVSQGYDIQFRGWTGYVAPAGLPKDVLDYYVNALKKVTDNPDHQAKMKTAQLDWTNVGGPEFAKVWADLEAEIKPLIAEAKAAEKK